MRLARLAAASHAVDSPRGVTHVIGMGALVTVLLVAMLIPRTVPVIIWEKGSDFEISDDYVEFAVTAYKLRDCDPVLPVVKEIERDGKVIVLHRAEIRGANGRWLETLVEFVDDDTPVSSRTPSWIEIIDFDRWRFMFPKRLAKPPVAARLPMSHLCGEDRHIAVRTVMTFPIVSPRYIGGRS